MQCAYFTFESAWIGNGILNFLLLHGSRLFGHQRARCILAACALHCRLDYVRAFKMAKLSGSSPHTLNPSLSVESTSAEVSKENGSGNKSKTLPSQFRASSGTSLHSLTSFSTRSDSGGQELSPALALIVGKVGCVARWTCAQLACVRIVPYIVARYIYT